MDVELVTEFEAIALLRAVGQEVEFEEAPLLVDELELRDVVDRRALANLLEFEKLILDAEMLQMMAEYLRPIEVNDDELALDAIAEATRKRATSNEDEVAIACWV